VTGTVQLAASTLRARTRLQLGDPSAEPDIIAHCDNLDLASALPQGAFQLLYLDPPFFTGTTRRGPTGDFADAFADRAAYLSFLRPRLQAAHRLLADDGNLFIHLDWHASHYVKVMLDDIFGDRHFVNEIVWCYSVGGKSRRAFARKHDTLLYYAKTADYAFHGDQVRIPRRHGSHMRVREIGGETMQEKTDRKTGRVYRYPVPAGKIPEDWWIDIETLNRDDAERTRYPTQKPERLLERIVRAGSDPGRLVGDLFLGSGTTAVVARRLGRRFAGSDVSASAIAVTLARLKRAGVPESKAARDVVVLETSNAPTPL
jgi:DNA modification methylase